MFGDYGLTYCYLICQGSLFYVFGGRDLKLGSPRFYERPFFKLKYDLLAFYVLVLSHNNVLPITFQRSQVQPKKAGVQLFEAAVAAIIFVGVPTKIQKVYVYFLCLQILLFLAGVRTPTIFCFIGYLGFGDFLIMSSEYAPFIIRERNIEKRQAKSRLFEANRHNAQIAHF